MCAGYQTGGKSNGSSGGSAISPEGWLFNICLDPGRCVSTDGHTLLPLADYFVRLMQVSTWLRCPSDQLCICCSPLQLCRSHSAYKCPLKMLWGLAAFFPAPVSSRHSAFAENIMFAGPLLQAVCCQHIQISEEGALVRLQHHCHPRRSEDTAAAAWRAHLQPVCTCFFTQAAGSCSTCRLTPSVVLKD